MSRPEFLADHNLNEQIVAGVVRRCPGLEFRRVREFGFVRRNDAFLLNYAAEQGFIIVSHDVNTISPYAEPCCVGVRVCQVAKAERSALT